MTPRLLSIATAVPPYVLHQDEVAAKASELFAADFADFSRLAPVYANAAIATRHSCVPIDWYLAPHGFAERNRLYVDNALELLERVARDAVARAGLTMRQIDGIVTVSSSGIATPSLDARLMDRLGLRRDVERLPIFGLGCAGGVLGLGRAAALSRAAPDSRILFLVVELCGLTFRYADRSKSNVIATALFGDGAAGGVIACDGDGPRIADWGEHTWEDSLDVMGWNVRDDGLAVLFSRDIPALVGTRMREVALHYLGRRDLDFDDIDRFVSHPGGAKVVDALEDVFGLERGAMTYSRDTLRDYGNMSAVTVIFALAVAEARAPLPAGQRCLLSALGPGFTAGFATLEAD